MPHTLHLALAPRRGALLRVLALIERRGFVIERVETGPLAAAADDPDAPAAAVLVVRGAQPIDVLGRQLQRLLDVRAVHIPEPTDSSRSAER